MCLIIHKPAGVEVPADLIRNAWEDNPDGAGLMWRDSEGAQTYKILPGAWADPAGHIGKVLSDLAGAEVGIHFRWRTHGPINEDMTHPYPIHRTGAYLMHNGVLPTGDGYTDKVSDTFWYISTKLHDAPGATDADFWDKVGRDITSSKFLLMDASGTFLEVNPKLWHGYKGLTLSNTHSIPELANFRLNAGRKYRSAGRKYWTGVDYADMDPRWRDVDEVAAESVTLAGDGWTATAGTTRPLPAKLTRRERKVLRDCLRVGHWGPFDRLGRVGK